MWRRRVATTSGVGQLGAGPRRGWSDVVQVAQRLYVKCRSEVLRSFAARPQGLDGQKLVSMSSAPEKLRSTSVALEVDIRFVMVPEKSACFRKLPLPSCQTPNDEPR